MASNLERLKAKKASNLKKEADLSTSFSIDAGEDEQKITINNTDIAHETQITEDKKSEIEPVIANPAKESAAINNSKEIKPIKAISNSNNSNVKKSKNTDLYNGSEKNLGIRLASEEDKKYLNMVPLSRSMTKKAFFIELMEEEFDNIKTIDINDPEIERFRNSALRTASITISVPEDLIEDIKKYAAKHMMKPQRYIAYVINKARTTDKSWY